MNIQQLLFTSLPYPPHPRRDECTCQIILAYVITQTISYTVIRVLSLTHQPTMAVARNSLRGFLTHAKDALRSAIKSNQKVTLVIGNESAGQHLQCTNESI